jgi:hypothetical protein
VAEPAPQYLAHHLTAGRATAWFVIAVAALGAVDIIRSGETGTYLAGLLVAAAICLVCYDLGLRPAVLEDIDGVCVRNPLRTTVIAWSSVTAVDVTDVLRVHAGDRVVRCFAVPRRRPRPQRPALGLGRPPTEFGFGDMAPPAAKGRSSGPPVSRSDTIASRLRERADAVSATAGQRAPQVRLARDAVGTLGAAAVLLVLAAVL